VTADAQAGPVGVRQGEVVRLSAWVRVPETIRSTERGAIVNLLGFDASGKAVPGWESMRIEANRHRKTCGWTQLTITRRVDDARIAKVGVRLGICGSGACDFDDVRLCRLVPAGRWAGP